MSTGGNPDDSGGKQDLSDLQDNLNRQQAKISALKELVRQSDAAHGKSKSSAQEKVKNIAQRLTHIKSKARSRQNLDTSLGEIQDEPIFEETTTTPVSSPMPSRARSETPGSEKIQLLRRQVEENKTKMAERMHSKREIEERVTQLKAKLDSTQQSLERSSELGRSMGDLSVLSPGTTKDKFKSASDLSFTPLNLDKEKIKFLENRIKLLEKQIEKQQSVAVATPVSESEAITSLKNRILDLEENLREKECIIEARTQAVSLMSESLSAKTATTVDTLEDTRLEMQRMQQNFIESESDMQAEIRKLHEQLEERDQKIRNMEEVNDILETARFELTVKNAELEGKLQDVQEYSTKLDELNKLNEALQLKISTVEDQLTEKTVEYNVLNANFSVLQEKLKATAPKSLFSKTGNEEAEQEIKKLKDQLDETNKGMIKTKLKTKQLQKQVDSFKKMSDAHGEVIRLTDENQQLQMKIVELEEEKGSLQLKLLSGGAADRPDDSEMEKKLQVLETTCQNQTSAIQLLEEQKLELQTTNQELEAFKEQTQKSSVKSEPTVDIASQIESIHLEEQNESVVLHANQLKADLERVEKENETLRERITTLEEEKQELQKKIDCYIAENIELLDKVEKLSKSSSSAESIEIVERLTQQERMEMEAFNKTMSTQVQDHDDDMVQPKEKGDDNADGVMGSEISDSLVKLREESSELMHRIELFTTERREVLGKMEVLTSENQNLQKQIADLKEEKTALGDNLTKTTLEIISLEDKLDTALVEKSDLEKSARETIKLKEQMQKELNTLLKAKKDVATVSDVQLKDKCTSSLSQLNNELENYRKSNDKSSRLNASKKLAKEVKNACQQFTELLDNLQVVDSLQTEATNEPTAEDAEMKNRLTELETLTDQLKAELDESKNCSEEKDLEILQLNKKVASTQEQMDETREQHDQDLEKLEQIRKELEGKLGAAENEIDILKTLVAEQKQQLIDAFTEHELESNTKATEIESYELKIEKLNAEIESLRSNNAKSNESFVDQLKEEIVKLQSMLATNDKIIAEHAADIKNKQDTIDSLNAQIMDLYKTMEENANKVIEKDDEIAYLQELLDSNKNENQALVKENEENKRAAEKLLVELHANQSNTEKMEMLNEMEQQNKSLEARIKSLEKTNNSLETKNKEQVEKLKKFAANLKKKTVQCTELETKLKDMSSKSASSDSPSPDHENVIHALEVELQTLRDQIRTMEASNVSKMEMQAVQDELVALRHEKDAIVDKYTIATREIESLKREINQYQSKVEYFERNINEVHALVDILHKDTNVKDDEIRRLRSEIEASQNDIRQHQENLKAVNDELKNKTLKFEKSKSVIKEKNREIQRLSRELENLQQSIQSTAAPEPNQEQSDELAKLRDEYDRLALNSNSERESFQQTINRLETLYDGIQAKFHENMSYIESLETENNMHKEKNVKLENFIATFEERRQSMERQTDLLDAQLQEKTDEYERNEDALIYRLNMLLDHDDCIGKRLIETQEAKEEISSKLEQLRSEHAELQMSLSQTTKELEEFKSEKVGELTAEIESLREQLENSRQELTRQQNIYEGRLAQKHAEIDDMETDLSVQLNSINQDKRKVQESLEKCQDEINDLKDENVRLKESANSLEQTRSDLERELTWLRMQNENMTQDQYELQELRMQSMQDKTEIENMRHQMDTLIQNHEIELSGLREQINELDSVRMQVGQNQTDDQVFIETENKRLKEQLAEKESAIENYQRENLKLQMASMLGGPPPTSASDPFSGDAGHPTETTTPLASSSQDFALRERIKALEDELARMQNILTEKEQECQAATIEAQASREQHFKLQQETSNLRADLQNLRSNSTAQDLPAPNSFFTATTSDASSSVFDELVTAHHVTPLQQELNVGGQTDQKKIEDLQRNVSDLEKYANDLENKLKNLTVVHENTLLQLQEQIRRYDETVKQYEERIQSYEELVQQHKQKIDELEVQRNVESLIVTETANVETHPSLNMFFSKAPEQPVAEFDRLIQARDVDATDQAGQVLPVEEEVIVAKKAYVLYPEQAELSTALDAEEGWGWGSEEAALEERHQTELLQARSIDQTQIDQFKMRIEELELERNRADEKSIELQVKCGKLMKKLKEYKSRIDQAESERAFRKSASIESSDLDLAIQEELKSQLKMLEEKNAEVKKQCEKEQLEKENLIKRVDVLSAANDRMTEMKERQDIEVEGLQMRVRQLSQQLKQMEDWGDREDESAHAKPDESSSVASSEQHAELENKLKTVLKELEDLRVDRDELQALLDDEKDNVLMNEKKIAELKAKIDTLEASPHTQTTSSEAEQTLQNYQQILAEKEAELANAIQMNQNFQFQLNDYQATVGQLSSESDTIKSHLASLQSEYAEKVNENAQLSENVKAWMEKCETFSKEIETLKVKSDATIESAEANSALEEKIQDLTSQVQYKEAEILHLKQKIQDQIQEDQTQHLVQEILGKNQEIVQLRMQVQQLESDKTELENNLSKQITEEMAQRTAHGGEEWRAQVQTLEKELESLRQEKQQMETELQVLNNHVMTSLSNEDKIKETILELDTKNLEIAELRSTVDSLRQQKQHQSAESSKNAPEVDVDARIAEVNKSWEQTIEQKCAEIAESWRQYMEQRENEFKQTESSLNLEIEQLRAGIPVLRRTISDDVAAEKVSGAIDTETLDKMRTALEQQELEIVTLKEQLAIRSAEYARLASRLDPYAMSTSSNISFESKTQRKLSTSSSGTAPASEQAGVVAKSELDLALYMLHQRDMRCEELTLELVNLLEERDTLQLKLSNSLRQIEETRQKAGCPESEYESDQVSSNPNSPDKSSKTVVGSENEPQADNLSSKLSQLQSMGYTKDKRIREEREQRQRQMENFQQDVANIPSEAVSELVGADITNAIQSPSNVLLDWLWGKNNPQ